jgi:short subunit dehydrogenase-like uncharacterized protein
MCFPALSIIIATIMSNNNTDKTDITVYGATSFVAKHILRYLLEASKYQPKSFRIGLAGRSKTKLELLQESFANTNGEPTIIQDIFIADGSDLAGLKKLAQQSRVVLNCAGPYSKYSSNVVAACAEVGTDYVDITGEVAWVAEMRQKYGKLAKSSGARIVSLCGYDAIPSDIALFAAVQTLREKVPSANIETATVWHETFGMPNGGTIHTALDIPIDLKRDILNPMSQTGNLELRRVPFFLGDPLLLTHPEQVRHNPDLQSTKNRYALGEWLNQLLNIHSDFAFGVSIPMFMAPVNMKVLQASSIALKYGPNFSVRERYAPFGFFGTKLVGILGLVPAVIFQVCMLCTVVLAKLPIVGKAIANFLAPPGSGVPDSISKRGTTAVYATATSKMKDHSGQVDRGYAYLAWQGDAGNLTTAQCVCESALALLFDTDALPERSEDGFGTPAEIFGNVLLKRFRDCEVRPVEVQTMVRTDVNQREMKLYIKRM